jgi:hypothetical protein
VSVEVVFPIDAFIIGSGDRTGASWIGSLTRMIPPRNIKMPKIQTVDENPI